MLQNYFTIAWRNIRKNKVFSLINIFGLSVGIAFSLLIGAYAWSELQVNRQLKNVDNQYIILNKFIDPNFSNEIGTVAELPKTLQDNYPNLIANYHRFDEITSLVSKNDKHFREELQIGDSTLLKMYGFKVLHGDVKTALKDPYSVVISGKMADKYFGRTDVVGQTINFESFSNERHDFTISAVLDDIPRNSVTSMLFDVGFFFNTDAAKFFKRSTSGWWNLNIVAYLELKPGVDPKTVNSAMKQILLKYQPDGTIKKQVTPYLVKLTDYNLEANNGLVKKMIYTLSCIALFILFMAIINFVNICIGRSAGRIREMGVRKALGSLRKHIILQFLIESIVLVMISTLIALIIYLVAKPYFSDVLGKEMPGLFAFPVYAIPVYLVFALLVGVLAGLHPAIVLSASKPVDSLKGKLSSIKESVVLRKTLVAFQFTIAAMVLIGALIISQQVKLFFSNSLGFKKENVIYAQTSRDWSQKGVQKMEYIRSQLAQLPQVRNVAVSYEIPDGHNGGNYMVNRPEIPNKVISSTGLVCDDGYLATYKIPLKAGQFFNAAYSKGDSSKVVINETEAKILGWQNAEDAIGKPMMIWAYSSKPFTIIGVTADFHFGSMRDKVQPITFMSNNYQPIYRYLSIRLKPGNIQSSLIAVQKRWTALMPDTPFGYKFIDDALAKVYATELQLRKAASIATALSIIIVLLGVLGLISLSVQKRTKEIGIRKVLGASVNGIVMLFMKDFLITVAMAGTVACPLAYLIMTNWLNSYASRISITPIPFVITIVVLTVLTAVLISLQTVKAALANPVESLRVDN
ncbi:ABC transporter permease [Mucilaginibacter sp. UR6-11]|uniref:ABC transporter permease n=1 Tax=Mucilaginibacter sp. UR6-11 TaxID=1435644 RepID=UPI001E4850DA|nr:ABC transporter permease [Mucilaginibacter sp. UR6-11]MCC8423788.1 ABC transporter permease [Mucilaginibacter sp. UR6-11]